MHSQSTVQKRSAWSSGKIWTWLFSITVASLLLAGWQGRDNSYLSATDGAGYTLGIIGGSLMLLLLLYPLRKSFKAMQGWGPIKYWFQMHMLFGVLGPVLVLFHSNFSLGSTNSNLALFSMLIVAGSGLIGRYFYSKIHFGLYGQKASLKELRQDLQLTKGNLGAHISLSPRIIQQLKTYEKFMLKNRFFILHIVFLPVLALRSMLITRKIKWNLLHDLKKQATNNSWSNEMLKDFKQQAKDYLYDYFYCLRKTSQLSLYARLFSWWHILHLPLFIMLVITGIVHVIAVHMY
ncbi:MAG: hypothetical protein PVF28_03125 [Thioalkalispiraceae bacterium]|jgi:hypothetical protein